MNGAMRSATCRALARWGSANVFGLTLPARKAPMICPRLESGTAIRDRRPICRAFGRSGPTGAKRGSVCMSVTSIASPASTDSRTRAAGVYQPAGSKAMV